MEQYQWLSLHPITEVFEYRYLTDSHAAESWASINAQFSLTKAQERHNIIRDLTTPSGDNAVDVTPPLFLSSHGICYKSYRITQPLCLRLECRPDRRSNTVSNIMDSSLQSVIKASLDVHMLWSYLLAVFLTYGCIRSCKVLANLVVSLS